MKMQGLLHPPKRTGCLLVRDTQKDSDFFFPHYVMSQKNLKKVIKVQFNFLSISVFLIKM